MTDTLPLLLPTVPGKVHGIVSLDPPTSRGHRKCRACIRISQAKYVQNRNRSA